MEALGVCDRLRCDREHEALGHDPVPDMFPMEDIQEEAKRVTGTEDLGRPGPGLDIRGRRYRRGGG
jgi:hypothetical protein